MLDTHMDEDIFKSASNCVRRRRRGGNEEIFKTPPNCMN
jgi:hypothetical protein